MTANVLKFSTPIRVAKLSGDPASTENGMLYYNTTSNFLKAYINGSWQQTATKADLDAVAAGVDPKESVRVATAAALPAVTYANGTGGVGATLTSDTNININTGGIDGVTTLAVNDRILVKDQATGLQNGIYVVTQLGSTGVSPFILTRSTDFDGSPSNEVNGGEYTFVKEGSSHAATGWIVYAPNGTATIGTDTISWTQFLGAPVSIKSLTDVDDAMLPSSDQVLTYDGSEWTARTLSILTNTNVSIKNLNDVNDGMLPSSDQVLYYDGSAWTAGTLSILTNANVSIKNLNDVNDGMLPSSNQVLYYDGSAWTAGTLSILTNANVSIKNLSDVSDGMLPSSDQVLYYNGSEWTAGTLSLITNANVSIKDLNDVDDAMLPATGAVLRYDGSAWNATSTDLLLDGSSTVSIQTASTERIGVTANGAVFINDFFNQATAFVVSDNQGSVGILGDFEAQGNIALHNTATSGLGTSCQIYLDNDLDAAVVNIFGSMAPAKKGSYGAELTLETVGALSNKILMNTSIDILVNSYVRRGDYSTPTQLVSEKYWGNITLTGSTTAVVTTISWSSSTFDCAQIEYRMRQATTNATRTGRLMVATDGTTVSISDSFAETADTGITWTAALNSGNVELTYTNASANAVTMRADGKFFPNPTL